MAQTQKQKPKVYAVIPAYNEQLSIASVVRKAKKYVDKVLVMDDGSTDGTYKQALQVADEIVRYPHKGVGMATGLGLLRCSYDGSVVVTLDADGQHNADYIPALLEPIIKSEADLVIGSRFLKESKYIPKYRNFGISLITWFYNLGHKRQITDAQCCFRAYGNNFHIVLQDKGFGFSVESLIKARKQGLRITEVPITCFYHKDYKRNSTLSPLKHGLLVMWAILKWRILCWN